MLTKQINFFGQELNVNVSCIVSLRYAFEFNKDMNKFLNQLINFAKKNVEIDKDNLENLDFEMLNSCNEVAYVMLKYGNNDNFKYTSYEEFLSDFKFLDLSLKAMEIVSLYIDASKPILSKRTNVKKNKHKKGR